MAFDNTVFITATDTSVGKTYISGLLLAYLIDHGINCGYQKWISTGNRRMSEDLAFCLQLAEIPFMEEMIDQHVPYRFQFPAAPHLAAELDNREVKPEIILANYEAMSIRYQKLIVEGVGGLMVPLRRDLLLIDFMAPLKIKTILVCRSGLGTINHSLLSIEALRHRNIPLLGLVFTDSGPGEDEILSMDNMKVVEELGRTKVFGRLPWCENTEDAKKCFAPIGEKIAQVI